jgi:hypothetical protein
MNGKFFPASSVLLFRPRQNSGYGITNSTVGRPNTLAPEGSKEAEMRIILSGDCSVLPN